MAEPTAESVAREIAHKGTHCGTLPPSPSWPKHLIECDRLTEAIASALRQREAAERERNLRALALVRKDTLHTGDWFVVWREAIDRATSAIRSRSTPKSA